MSKREFNKKSKSKKPRIRKATNAKRKPMSRNKRRHFTQGDRW